MAPKGGACLGLGAGLGAETELTLAALVPAEFVKKLGAALKASAGKMGFS